MANAQRPRRSNGDGAGVLRLRLTEGGATRPLWEGESSDGNNQRDWYFYNGRAAARAAFDDMALVHACKRGDAAAFEQLVKRYDRRLLSIAQNVTHNREDAQDAVQEAFLKVFRRLSDGMV